MQLNTRKTIHRVTFLLFLIGCQSLVAAESETVSQLTPAQSLLPMLGGLMGILVLIFLLAAVLKKFTSLNLVSGHMKVIDTQNLGSKEKLVIVEIQNKQYVLGVTAHTINPVCELEEPIVKKESNLSFDKLMKQMLNPAKAVENFANKQAHLRAMQQEESREKS